MDIAKIHELTSGIKTWQEMLSQAESRKAQAENDIFIAEREINLRKRKLSELMKPAAKEAGR